MLFTQISSHNNTHDTSLWSRITHCVAADVPQTNAHSFLHAVLGTPNHKRTSKKRKKRKRQLDTEAEAEPENQRQEIASASLATVAHDPKLSLAKRVAKSVFSHSSTVLQEPNMLTYFKEALRDHPDEAELTEEETKKRLDERLCVRPLGEGRLRILICPKNRVDQEVSDIVSSLAQKYSCELCDAFVLHSAPADHAYLTYEQQITWPLNASSRQPDPNIVELSEEEIQQALKCLFMALQEACHTRDSWRSCVLFDPDNKVIITSAVDKSRRRDFSNIEDFFNEKMSRFIEHVKSATNNPWYLPIENTAEEPNPLNTEVMQCIDQVALVDRSRSSDCPHPEELRPVAKFRTEQSYLCTGYYAFLTVEPDAMDAMALLHSRIKRVIYLCTNEEEGSLGSKSSLHTSDLINHRYEVFKANTDSIETLISNLIQSTI